MKYSKDISKLKNLIKVKINKKYNYKRKSLIKNCNKQYNLILKLKMKLYIINNMEKRYSIFYKSL